MSELRKQLQSARAAYERTKYPGNLAAEVLPDAHVETSWRWKLIIGGLAAAAAIAVMVWPQAPSTDTSSTVALSDHSTQQPEVLPQPSDFDAATDASHETESVSVALNEVPTLPEIGPLWADAQTDTGEVEQLVPSFPSMSELTAAENESEPSKENR